MFGFQKQEDTAEVAISPTEWLDEVLKEAVREEASDIHIVPYSDKMVVNFRVDGAMRKIDEWRIENHENVISRIKILAGLKVVEKRFPQDGHMEIMLNWFRYDEGSGGEESESKPNVAVDGVVKKQGGEGSQGGSGGSGQRNILANFRVSTMPTIHGETAVLRALNRSNNLVAVEDLGLSEKALPVMMSMIRKSHGMMLLTGPTGAGKTTTLYSVLNRIQKSDNTVLTLEDPVEYRLPGVRQTQINPHDENGLSWSEGLKATLRQDPDAVMVGEIRDEETAEIAIHASLSGRKVFSTFHTNSVEAVLIQLLTMNIERSSIASALMGVITQRLVREICSNCRVKTRASEDLIQLLELDDEWRNLELYTGQGCRECEGTGYRGRQAIFEILALDEELRALILQNKSFRSIEQTTRAKIPQSLKEDGLEKVRRGVTTLEEVVHAVI